MWPWWQERCHETISCMFAPKLLHSEKRKQGASRKYRRMLLKMLHSLCTPNFSCYGYFKERSRILMLSQKCANIFSRCWSPSVSRQLGQFVRWPLVALPLSQRWIDFNPHYASVTFVQRCKRSAHVSLCGMASRCQPCQTCHFMPESFLRAELHPASHRGSVKSPLFCQCREKAKAVWRTASLHFFLSLTHALLEAL